MNFTIKLLAISCLLLFLANTSVKSVDFIPQTHSSVDSANLQNGYLVYHFIKTDEKGKIIPWYSANLGNSYDHVLGLVWNFWDTMKVDPNGLPYYMNHQVWEDKFNDGRGVAGSQFEMTLSSWYLYYVYTGNKRVMDNMTYVADYYLSHSLSAPKAAWPNIPYPYNTLVYSGIYDGDMILGKDFTQPDKAGGFGYELVNFYKMNGNERYLNAAIDIANTLAKKIKKGDNNNSPLPFKVNAETGKVGVLIETVNGKKHTNSSSYSSNWTGTMQLFQELQKLDKGNTALYKKSFTTLLEWMKAVPLKTNKWGPFFEDVNGWSDAQINAITFARFMMKNQALFPEWKTEVAEIFDWTYSKLGNNKWKNYGVTVVNEQTAYPIEGNSHTARQASVELLYAQLTGETDRVENAVRQLNWATYMVDFDGKNQYPNEQIWTSDGYVDYVRHYLRAMDARPELSPDNGNHLLSSTSTIQRIEYYPNYAYGFWSIALSEQDLTKGKDIFPKIRYFTYDKSSKETIRLVKKPVSVTVNKIAISETSTNSDEGWTWQSLDKGGVATINHTNGNEISIIY